MRGDVAMMSHRRGLRNDSSSPSRSPEPAETMRGNPNQACAGRRYAVRPLLSGSFRRVAGRLALPIQSG